MDVKELRRGNIIEYLYPHENEWGKLTVSVDEIVDFEDNQDSFKPIPLTEEWLIKFGFSCVIGHGYKKNGFKGKIFGYSTMWHHHSLRVEMKYVHQLQNLYFALTQKELTYEKFK